MLSKLGLLLVTTVCALSAEILDKLVISVGQQVITELQLDEEIRVTALLNHEPVARTKEERRAAADRLIQQLLVTREMKVSHYPFPQPAAVEKYFGEVRAGFGSGDDFNLALSKYEVTDDTLKQHLRQQLATMQFVEYRFRPDMEVSETEIEEYYRREILARKANQTGQNIPTLEASRASIRQAVIEERTNQILDSWLEEGRKQINIVYLDRSLQ
jgi:hypothetical protein